MKSVPHCSEILTKTLLPRSAKTTSIPRANCLLLPDIPFCRARCVYSMKYMMLAKCQQLPENEIGCRLGSEICSTLNLSSVLIVRRILQRCPSVQFPLPLVAIDWLCSMAAVLPAASDSS